MYGRSGIDRLFDAHLALDRRVTATPGRQLANLYVNVKVWYHPRVTDATASTPILPPAGTERLLRIQEVAAETGLTTRAIRYYEEMGLLEPAARSDGAYRLFDASDLERLRFIRSLRDDAGFSLAQIGQLLEDDVARERNRERFRSTTDLDERRTLIVDAQARVDRQVATLEEKAARLAEMIDAARGRRQHLDAHMAELDGGPDPHPGAGEHPHPADGAHPHPGGEGTDPSR